MMSQLGITFVSFATFLYAFAIYRSAESISFENALTSVVVAALAWSLGAVAAFLSGPMARQNQKWSNALLGVLTLTIALIWLLPVSADSAIRNTFVIFSFVVAGFLGSTLVVAPMEAAKGTVADASEKMRDGYVRSLLGAAIGSLLGALLGGRVTEVYGLTPMFGLAAIGVSLALVSRSHDKIVRTLAIAFTVVIAGLAFYNIASFDPKDAAPDEQASKVSMAVQTEILELSKFPYVVKSGRPLDVFVLGDPASSIMKLHLEAGAKSVSFVRRHNSAADELQKMRPPEGVAMELDFGSGRRRLEASTRKFDLIQIHLPSDHAPSRFTDQAEALLTVESLKTYFDHLKDEGLLQVVPPSTGVSAARGQSILATVSEAWKRSARKDVDLHSLVITTGDTIPIGASTDETLPAGVKLILVRTKDFSREERDHLGASWKVGEANRGWVLPSDASGEILTDDRPFLSSPESASPAMRWFGLLTGVSFLVLIAWITSLERRKGVASRWQTFSIAVFFGGLGLSSALFTVFFVLRSMRAWGLSEMAIGLVLAVVLAALAFGAQVFAGHPKRRFGVRIQPLANFVFATLFSYLAGAFFEPIVASGSEWLSAFVGMSLLVPFGLLAGSFLPNALEEAAEKLHPKSIYLLWSCYAAGIGLGVFVAAYLGSSSGLTVVFLSGLFVFAWVAIIGGLVRPFSSRKFQPGT